MQIATIQLKKVQNNAEKNICQHTQSDKFTKYPFFAPTFQQNPLPLQPLALIFNEHCASFFSARKQIVY